MTDTHEPLPDKREVARALLLRGSVFVHLDPRHHGVLVPQHLRKQPQLVLQVGLDMAVAIPDLRVDQEGVTGTLSFNRSPFTCFVPWEAVFALAGDDARGMVWPPSMPPEIKTEIDREAGRIPPPALALARDDGELDDLDIDDDYDGASSDHDNVFDLSSRRPRPRLVPAPDVLDHADDADDEDETGDASERPEAETPAISLASDAPSAQDPVGSDDADDTDDSDDPDDTPTPPRGGHLRLVK